VIFNALIVGHLHNNAWRALVSIVAIALGVATALALDLANTLSIRTLDADRSLFTQRVDLQILPFGNRLPQGALTLVRYTEGVASAAPIIDRPATIGVDRYGAGGSAARMVGVDLLQPLPGVAGFDEGRPGPFAPVGSFIDPGAVIGTNGAIVSAATAARLRLHRGGSFAILIGARIVKLHVANVMPPSVTGVDSSVLFVDIMTAEVILHEPGKIDRIDVLTNAAPETVRAALIAAIGHRARVIVPEASGFSLGALTSGIEATFGALASIALGVGGLLVFNAVGTSIAHRRGDIGTLRTLGVAPASIIMAFITEGAAYGALGGVLGVVLAEFAVEIIESSTRAQQNVGEHNVWTFVLAVLLGIGVAVFSSIAPALSATRIAPALAARQGSFDVRPLGGATLTAQTLAAACAFALALALSFHPGHAAWFMLGFPLSFTAGTVLVTGSFSKAIGGVARLVTLDAPPSLRFAGLTLAAIPKRVAVALAALSVAVFAAVAFDVASVSFATSLHAWAVYGIAGDLHVRPFGNGSTFDASVAARIRATPGVRDVVAVRTIRTQTGSTDVAVRGEDELEPVPHVMMTEPPAELGAQLAATLHVKAGDVIALRAPHRDLHVRVTSVRPDFSNARGSIIVARGVLRKAFGDNRIDALRVTIYRQANPTSVENAIARRLAPLRTVIVTTRELRDRLTSAFDETFLFVRTLAVVVVMIASLGVASTLSALVFERRYELRMLRTLGTPRSTIVRMLASEALVIALSGSVLGLLIGIAFAAMQLYAVDPVAIGFAIPLTVPYASVTAVFIAAVAAAVAGPVLAAPAAFRIATDMHP